MEGIDGVQAAVDRAQGGDGAAFGELYERFAPDIRRYMLARVYGHRETAEDLAEEVFVKALRRLASYQPRGLPFAAWLYRIARNHLIDHVRTSRRAVASLDATPDLASPHAEQELAGSLDRHDVVEALALLSDEQRRVISLRFLGGHSTAETARMLGKSEDAVKKLQARGLARMRRGLEAGRRADAALAA